MGNSGKPLERSRKYLAWEARKSAQLHSWELWVKGILAKDSLVTKLKLSSEFKSQEQGEVDQLKDSQPSNTTIISKCTYLTAIYLQHIIYLNCLLDISTLFTNSLHDTLNTKSSATLIID